MKIVFFGNLKYIDIYKNVLEDAGHKFFLIKNFANAEEELHEIVPDLGIIACFGKIIPENILKIPKYGFLNVHPSLLPKWRGPSPVRSALLAGETNTGVTIHITTPKVDAGDIVAQEKHSIDPDDNYITLEEKLFKRGANMLPGAIEKWLNGDIKPQKQDELMATYSKKVRTEDGFIDWTKTSEEIINQIRAYSPDPGTYMLINGKRLKIKKAEIIENQLKLLIVQPEGKKDMSVEAYLRGHREILTKQFFKSLF